MPRPAALAHYTASLWSAGHTAMHNDPGRRTEPDLPGVSVVIPVYNASLRITACLDSIRSQDYPAHLIEILVIDDDSSDDTIQVVGGYGVTVLRNGARNIEAGKYIGLAH